MVSNARRGGAWVPTTNVWDVSEIYSTDVTSPEFKELLVRLYQNLNNMSIVLNMKDTGYYVTQEFVNGQFFFANPLLNSTTTTSSSYRSVMRKVINFGPLPDTATISKPHYIIIQAGATITFTRIYGCATNLTAQEYIPIPYASASAVANNVELYVDATNVNIVTAADYSGYTVCYVVLEYLMS